MPPMKGKWAQGIKPRNFAWVITDRLAVCERPGGYGANHRKVRRQEEIIWIREQGFTQVDLADPVAAQPPQLRRAGRGVAAPAVRQPTTPPSASSPRCCPSCATLLAAGEKLLVHQDELGDRVQGLMAAFLRWAGMIDDDPRRSPSSSGCSAASSARSAASWSPWPRRSRAPSRRRDGVTDRVIELRGLRLTALVGVLPEEQRAPAAPRGRPRRRTSTSPRPRPPTTSPTPSTTAPCAIAEVERVLSAGHVGLLERLAAIGRRRGARARRRDQRRRGRRCASCGRRCRSDLATSGVRIRRTGWMTRAFLGLGSNLGDREAAPAPRPSTGWSPSGWWRLSPCYETDPVGGPEQGPFLNLVAELDTDLSARQLLAVCGRLEAAAERVRVRAVGAPHARRRRALGRRRRGRRARPRRAPPADVGAPLRPRPPARPRPRPRLGGRSRRRRRRRPPRGAQDACSEGSPRATPQTALLPGATVGGAGRSASPRGSGGE